VESGSSAIIEKDRLKYAGFPAMKTVRFARPSTTLPEFDPECDWTRPWIRLQMPVAELSATQGRSACHAFDRMLTRLIRHPGEAPIVRCYGRTNRFARLDLWDEVPNIWEECSLMFRRQPGPVRIVSPPNQSVSFRFKSDLTIASAAPTARESAHPKLYDG
jgi:hypothetical protein